MKRKFKLFATVASLCLCLALMAFGVYAATTVTYNVGGSVTFTVSDLLLDISTEIKGLAQPTDGHKEGWATANGSEAKEGATWVKVNGAESEKDKYAVEAWQSYVTKDGIKTARANTNGMASLVETKSVESALDFDGYSAFQVKITVKSYDGFAIGVTASLEGMGSETNKLVNARLVDQIATNATEVAAQGEVSLIYYIELISPSTAASGNWGISLAFAKKA